MTGTGTGDEDKERQSSQRDENGNARERNWIRKGGGKTVRRRKAERQKHRNSGGEGRQI